MHTLLLALIIVVAPSLALAHPHHTAEAGIYHGLLHPFLGVDHLLAMLAVGLWAALSSGRALIVYPATFVLAMVVGGLIGAGSDEMAGIEPMILTSVIVLGAVTALALRLPLFASVGLLAIFGFAHGHAHGVEGPAGLDLGYAAGFALATMALHLIGLALGLALARARAPLALRGLGAVVAVGGLFLAVGIEAEAQPAKPLRTTLSAEK